MPSRADIPTAVIGGSGLYRLFDPAAAEQLEVSTPFGSAEISVGTLAGRRVAFLTRHGAQHSVPPHRINYRANIWALRSLGVRSIVSSSAVGGIGADYPPGVLVVTDQFIDRTHGRADTFFADASVQHLPAADPFCPELATIARRVLREAGEDFRETGTVVVVQGPRFSTRAESLWYRAAGADIVNMTLYPEVPLAAELNMGTVNLSFVTDRDAGVVEATSDPGQESVTSDLVFDRLAAAQPRIVAAIEAIVRAIPADYEPRELIAPAAVDAVLAEAAR
ncbi:MTAP family purine nucleoside phosphorylase [Leifsonia aquatica]|uniref:MTAP family purine nucleoside phosphorylase n=1 Tax=Leifsonia aquatica TaxID=144185 RepID=UPI00384A5EE9